MRKDNRGEKVNYRSSMRTEIILFVFCDEDLLIHV